MVAIRWPIWVYTAPSYPLSENQRAMMALDRSSELRLTLAAILFSGAELF